MRRLAGLALTLATACGGSGAPESAPSHPSATTANATPTTDASATSPPTASASSRPSAAAPVPTRCGDGGKHVRFKVKIGDGVDHDRDRFARQLLRIYCDERGWLASGAVRFTWKQGGSRDDGVYLIRLLNEDGIRHHCGRLLGQPVSGNYSCAGSARREINLHADRWFGAVDHWQGSRATYRAMLALHEMGHALTLRHVDCPANGAKAPVMMQQSISMTHGGRTCRENPWPRSEELRRMRDAWR